MKRRTGSKKVARAIALALATVITVTSVPMAVIAGDDDATPDTVVDISIDPESGGRSTEITIEVPGGDNGNQQSGDNNGSVTLDFSSGNLDDNSQQAVADAHNSDVAADSAQSAASDAAAAATAAGTAATNAETAATNAEAAAQAAQNMANAIENIDVTTPTGLVNTAETAVNTANTAIGTYNNAVDEANGKIDTANNSKLDNSETGTPGTDSLIAAAKDEKEGSAKAKAKAAVQDAKDNNVTQETIKGVKNDVDEADSAYKDANSDAVTAIGTAASDIATGIGTAELTASEALKSVNEQLKAAISGTDVVKDAGSAAEGAEMAKNEAQKQEGAADTALGKTQESYDKVKDLVDSGSHDVASAQQYADDAAQFASDARTAANNAKAAAGVAAAAEEVAKNKLDVAQKAVDNAITNLVIAWGNYKTAYGNAKQKADKADGKVTDLIGDEENKGKIEIANEKIDAAIQAVNDYNNKEVKNANDAIENTNKLIGEAQDAINALDSSEMDEKTAAAVKAVTDAQDALDKAGKDVTLAKSSYDAAMVGKMTAEGYAGIAETEAGNAEAKVTEINNKVTIAKANETITKDNLAKATNGVDYNTLDQAQKDAASAYNTADENKKVADGEYEKALKAQADVYAVQNPIIQEKQGIIDTETANLGSAKSSGLYKEQKDLADEITNIDNAVNAYNQAKKDEDDLKIKYDALSLWDYLYGKGEVIAIQYGLAMKNTKNKLEDLNNAIGKSNQTGEQALQTAVSKKSAAENQKAIVDANITAAEGRKTTAENEKKAAEGLKAAEDQKVNSANVNKTKAERILSEKEAAKNLAEANIKKVDDFTVTEENSVVLSKQESQMVQDIIAAYGNGYEGFDPSDFSWQAMDADTNAYASDMSGTLIGDAAASFVNFWSNLFTGSDVMDDQKNAREQQVEAKYGNKGNVLIYWDNEEKEILTWLDADEKNLASMKNMVNKECVLICTNVERASEIRASLAVLNAAKAKGEAEKAAERAEAAKTRANEAKGNEATAKTNYETELGKVKKALDDAQIKLNGFEELDEKGQPIRNDDKNVKTKLDSKKEVKKLDPKYTDADKVSELVYDGPSKIEGVELLYTDRLAELPFEDLLKYLKAKQKGEKTEDIYESGIIPALSDCAIEELITVLEDLVDSMDKLDAAREDLKKADKEKDNADKLKISADETAKKAEQLAKDAADLAKKVTPYVPSVAPQDNKKDDEKKEDEKKEDEKKEDEKKDDEKKDDEKKDDEKKDNEKKDDKGDPTGPASDPGTEGGTPIYPIFTPNTGDDDGPGTPSTPSTPSEPVGDTGTDYTDAPVIPISTPILPFTAPSGVAGARTGRTGGRGQGVAGVKVENNKAAAANKQMDKADSKKAPSKEEKIVADAKTNKGSSKKINENQVPLDAAPTEAGINLSWLLLLGIAAVIVAVYMYNENRKKKAAADGMQKNKK